MRHAPQLDDSASLRRVGWRASRKAAAARRLLKPFLSTPKADSTTIGNYRICR
jgi:hypothetical protein